MELFLLKPSLEIAESAPKGGLLPEKGVGHGKVEETRIGSVPIDERVDPSVLTEAYVACVDEIFRVIKARVRNEDGSIQVEKVTVNLGVTVGGKVGLFVQGRADVALAFEVEFKVSPRA